MKIAYTNAVVLDGTAEMTPQPGMTVLTDGEQITAVVPDGQADRTDCEVIDLEGQYLMPGLINLHAHLPASGKPSKKQADARRAARLATCCKPARRLAQSLCEGYACTELMSGVTTLRTVGGLRDFDTRIRDKIRAGYLAGPRILAANMAVSVPGGHMAGSLACEVTTPEQAAACVRAIAAEKPDLIKLMITGGVLDAVRRGEPGALKMAPELVRAACDEAHALGLPVAAHTESPEGVRVALQNGVDTIEHGAKPDAEILKLFHDRKAALVATLSPAVPYALLDRSVSYSSEMAQYNGKVVFEGIVECAKACLAEGIPVGLGTDTGCPFVTHYDMWREVFYFHKYCGVSNAFALHTATLGNARIAGLADVTGSIQPGKCADLIVTRENPLQSLTALRRIRMVAARGSLLREPQIKRIPAVETALEGFLAE